MVPQTEEWESELHTLVVSEYDPDNSLLEFEIEHPANCPFCDCHRDGQVSRFYECAVGHILNETDLPDSLEYSGTPLPGPGTYQLRAWGRKYYVWDMWAYEYDCSLALEEARE